MKHDKSDDGGPDFQVINRELELLAELCEVVMQRELELTELLTSAREFRCGYLSVVGAPQAELDGINARIAQLRSQLAPDDPELEEAAERARRVAEEAGRAGDAGIGLGRGRARRARIGRYVQFT